MIYISRQLLFSFLVVLPVIAISGCDAVSFDRPDHWATPIHNWHLRNAYRVSEKLYRSAQPGLAAYREFHKLGVELSLDLRNEAFDAAKLRDMGIEQVHIPMNASSVTADQVVAALKVIDNSQKPVVVHCQAGADRTGAVVAFYRIVFEGWSKAEAIDEMVNGGYGFHSRYHNIITLIQNADIAAIKRRLEANSGNDKVGTNDSRIKSLPRNRTNG
ncbi:MAG: tyrosine-protein phosphatase [Gammaproteobacteria bacterium]|jgi:protein tyrosine/serine phosphatase